MPHLAAEQRSISEFVDSQGTFGGGYLLPNDPTTGLALFFDYAGGVNDAFGLGLPTTFSGSVEERPLADGTAEVHVILHTTNAYVDGWGPNGYVLGNIPEEVALGAPTALGDCSLEVKFTNDSSGAPLPDLVQLVFAPLPGQQLLFFGFSGHATGPLADGSFGFAQSRQTGLLATSVIANPNSRVALDAFPSEHILIQPIGK